MNKQKWFDKRYKLCWRFAFDWHVFTKWCFYESQYLLIMWFRNLLLIKEHDLSLPLKPFISNLDTSTNGVWHWHRNNKRCKQFHKQFRGTDLILLLLRKSLELIIWREHQIRTLISVFFSFYTFLEFPKRLDLTEHLNRASLNDIRSSRSQSS